MTAAKAQAHLAPADQLGCVDAEALCGYRTTGVTPDADADTCPRCEELAASPRPDSILVFTATHQHQWQSAGAVHHEAGWTPAYRCDVCGDEATDIGLLRKRAEAP